MVERYWIANPLIDLPEDSNGSIETTGVTGARAYSSNPNV
jgi:hypothetical protein